MTPSQPKRIFDLSTIACFLYALCSLLFSASTVGYVHDEPHYLDIGYRFLAERNFAIVDAYPPFAVWVGAVIPYLMGRTTPSTLDSFFYARLAHVFAYVLCGLAIAFFIRKKKGARAALLFSLLYVASPSLKAPASHHLTDTFATVIPAVAFVGLLCATALTDWGIVGAAFLVGLGVCSKVSVFALVPFVLVDILRRKKGLPALVRAGLLFAVGFFVAVVIAYQFRFDQLYLQRAVKSQLGHRESGHLTSLFGEFRTHGFLYYYIVTFFFKTPLVQVAAVVLSVFLWFRSKEKDYQRVFLLLVPAGLLFVLLSTSTVQIGYRYLNPAVLFVLVFAALQMEEFLTAHPKLAMPIIILLCTAFVGDFLTVKNGDYLAYFNFLTPKPLWNFVDSNADWNQGVPHHLQGEVPEDTVIPRGIVERLHGDLARPMNVLVGATEMGGVWKHPFGPVLRSFQPVKRLGGYLLFHFTGEEFVRALFAHRPWFYYGRFGLKEVERAGSDSDLGCANGAVIRNRVFSDLDGSASHSLQSLPDVPKGPMTVEMDVIFPSKHKTLLLLDSNDGVDFELNGTKSEFARPPISDWNEYSHWAVVSTLPTPAKLKLTYHRMVVHAPSNRRAQLLLFWAECR